MLYYNLISQNSCWGSYVVTCFVMVALIKLKKILVGLAFNYCPMDIAFSSSMFLISNILSKT